MDRRKLISALGIGATAGLLGCGQQKNSPSTETVSEKKSSFRWKLVTSWPKNFPGLGTAPENLAKLVSDMTAGAFQIKVYGAGELAPAMEVFDTVSLGTVEMGHCAAYYWKGKLPAAPFFTSVPFGLNAQEMNGWLHFGGAMPLWRELYKPFNLIPFPGGNTGVQMAGWFNKEINSIEDIKGLKMRIPGMAGEVWRRLGGTPVTLPGGELFTALQTGVIDATEWVGPYNDLVFGLHKAAKYYYYPGWHEPGSTLEFIVNETAYAALPEDFKAVLEQAILAVNQTMLDEYTTRNHAALITLVNEHQVALRPLPDDVLLKLREVSEAVVLETAKTSPMAEKIYKSFKTYQEQVQVYHQVSEVAYYQARALKADSH